MTSNNKATRIRREILNHKIVVLKFSSKRDMAATFLRFQEYYESPRFRGRYFTLCDFKMWYKRSKLGKFSYYSDWSGFNFPSRILTPFYEGKFDPLSRREKQLLRLVANIRHPFYVIGVHERCSSRTLKHELAHALFRTCKAYRHKVLAILKQFDLSTPRRCLRAQGYDNSVILDEIQAYAIGASSKINPIIAPAIRRRISRLFAEFQAFSR